MTPPDQTPRASQTAKATEEIAAQVTAMHGARRYRGDRLIRVASPHRLVDWRLGMSQET